MDKLKQELKREFQLERIIFFSDAVFAIAITLLVIELHIPEMEIHTNGDLLNAIRIILPDIFGFMISFFMIASFWSHHHSLFGYVKSYDPGLLWLNLLVLFFIVLIPFSTTLFGSHGNLLVATTIYSFNILAVGIMNYFLLRHVSRAGNKLSSGLEDKKFRKGLHLFFLAIPTWVMICWLIGLITSPAIGDLFIFGLSFIVPLSKKMFLKGRKIK